MEGNSLEESCTPSGAQEGAELIASTSVDGTMQTPVLQRAPCCHSEPSAHRRVPLHQWVPRQQPTGVPWQELMPQVDVRCAAAARTAGCCTGTALGELGELGRASVPVLNSKVGTGFLPLLPRRSSFTQPCCPHLLHGPSPPAAAALPATAVQSTGLTQDRHRACAVAQPGPHGHHHPGTPGPDSPGDNAAAAGTGKQATGQGLAACPRHTNSTTWGGRAGEGAQPS